jgi:acid phosphatase type 7
LRLFERLNTAAAVLMVLFVIVAVNAYLYFVYYLPQTSPPVSTNDPVLAGAGDIAVCGSSDDDATAKLLGHMPDATIVTLGDNAYEAGTAANFADCYDPSWGRFKKRTHPAAGNHEYHTPDASGYYDYFGAAAGNPDEGYYSYDLETWHVIVLNSNCSEVGGCSVGSPQEKWLEADLATHSNKCTLAYFHHPRFSSGSEHGNATYMKPVWKALYAANADVVLSAHEHFYERFAPQDPGGEADPERGIREFVVGTGGAPLYEFLPPKPNSQVRNADTHGVIKLTLHPEGYDWKFVPVAGEAFTDSGTASCH